MLWSNHFNCQVLYILFSIKYLYWKKWLSMFHLYPACCKVCTHCLNIFLSHMITMWFKLFKAGMLHSYSPSPFCIKSMKRERGGVLFHQQVRLRETVEPNGLEHFHKPFHPCFLLTLTLWFFFIPHHNIFSFTCVTFTTATRQNWMGS